MDFESHFSVGYSVTDDEVDMDVHDRGMLYYRLLKHNVREAQKVVCGQAKAVADENMTTHRVSTFEIEATLDGLSVTEEKIKVLLNFDFAALSVS